jgi:BASS family bile acid:Na+ symporter
MPVLSAPATALAWLGRQGTRAIAALVMVGIAVPPLGDALRPFVAEAVFLLLCTSFMRVDPTALRSYLRRPGLVLAVTVWSAVALPLLFGLGGRLVGIDARAPDLFLGLMLQGVASPMMAAPAFAALMGLDATLVLVTLVTCTILTPVSAAVFMFVFVGAASAISPVDLGVKLFFMLAGSALVAALLRRLFGYDAILDRKNEIDGFNIVALFVFVAAVMSGVAKSVSADPAGVLLLTLLAFAVFFAILIATMLLFIRIGKARAFALGFMAAQRNMGVMLAATGGAVPEMTWLYFALSQFPIYLSPQMLKPWTRRLQGADA